MSNSVNFYEFIGFITFNIEVHELVYVYNRNRNLKISKRYSKAISAPGTSLFTSAATNQRGVDKGGSREAQVRFPEYQEGTE